MIPEQIRPHQEEVNKHAKIIQDTVFHTYPYIPSGMFKPDTPHSEDCGGCLINAEVDKLVAELNALSPIEKIVEELKNEKEKRKALMLDCDKAFEKANVSKEGSVSELVAELVDDRDRLIRLLRAIKTDINNIAFKMRE